MKNSKNTLLLIIFILGSIFSSFGQDSNVKRSNNKVELNGKAYFIHIVRKGETLFAISDAYKIPVDTIKKDNLHLSSDIKINQYLKIRISEEIKTPKSKFLYHSVKKGDTPYNISLRYKVKLSDVYKFNPQAKMGIGIGEVIRIPLKQDISEKLEKELSDTLDSSGYIVHSVQKKETIYGIAAIYGTTQGEIKKLNPKLLVKPLQVGDNIKIPAKKARENNIGSEFYYHKVEKQETVYMITRKYNIKEKQLFKLNPDIKDRQIMIGELLKVPKNSLSESLLAEIPQVESLDTAPRKDEYTFWVDSLIIPSCPKKSIDSVSVYKVAFFLPFYLNINDTLGRFTEVIVKDENGLETVETVPRSGKIEDKIYQRSKLFIDFYQGALLALLDLKEQGVSLDIHVFDTQNDSLHLKEILRSNNLESFNLFIGPVFGDMLKIVGDFAWENQINIVSPLSKDNNFIDNNPYAFQVSPPLEVQMHHASDFLNDFDTKNYIVIHDGKNLDQEYISQFKKQLFAQMNSDNFNQIKYNEVLYYDAQDSVLKEVFTKGIENVVIVPSGNQAFVTDILGKLNGYSYEYSLKVFGQPNWSRFTNIELENFHNTNTHIFSNSFIDYKQDNVLDFVSLYRNHFKNEPNKYAFHGYDITKYFCLALNIYGNDFRKCIHMHKTELLQTQFNFVPFSDQGGYQNTAIFILEYTKENTLKKVTEFPAHVNN